jgi:competence protein ComEA
VGAGEDVVVDVSGAVADSGVYRLPAGSRVEDAVKRAGGATAHADLETINLAARLSDGQQVVVPDRAPVAPTGSAASSTPGASDSSAVSEGPISLATATIADLDTIEGIGPVTAQDIIDFRDQHGGIGSIEDLNQISGIGPATMEALRARLQP